MKTAVQIKNYCTTIVSLTYKFSTGEKKSILYVSESLFFKYIFYVAGSLSIKIWINGYTSPVYLNNGAMDLIT